MVASEPSPRQRTGRLGEDAAARYLMRAGYQVVERNYRCRAGEIDLVARDGETLVFIEVRARTSTAFGTPEESVTARKQQKMIACALTYLSERGRPDQDWRIDVVAVTLDRGRVSRLDHYQHAIEGS